MVMKLLLKTKERPEMFGSECQEKATNTKEESLLEQSQRERRERLVSSEEARCQVETPRRV
jgi:hypothetical protein